MNHRDKKKPPTWTIRLLKIFMNQFQQQELQEHYEWLTVNENQKRARQWYIRQVLKIAMGKTFNYFYWSYPMLKSYFKVAFRNIKRHKLYSIINIMGLSIGISACLVMFMFVASEISYDNFHEHKKRIYRIVAEWGKKGSIMKFAGAMPGIAPVLNQEIPEIETAARIRKSKITSIFVDANAKIEEENIVYADNTIFQILSWNLTSGKKEDVLKEPFSIVLSEQMSVKYYPQQNPIGKTIQMDNKPYKITGVMQDIPGNTHLPCNMVISYPTIHALGKYPQNPWNTWGEDYTYFLLRDGALIKDVDMKLEELLVKNSGKWFAQMMTLIAQPLNQIHWDNESLGDSGPKGNKMYVYLFSAAALFVLLIAGFNYMNLSTSRYIDRMKEIGIRKVIGATRGKLTVQLLSESLIITTGAGLIAALLFIKLSMSIYVFFHADVIFSNMEFKYLCIVILIFIFVLGSLSAIYPALFLSRFKIVDIIRNRTFNTNRTLNIRRMAVVIQYALSTILILGTLVIFRQLNFVKNTDLGFDKNDVLMIRFPSDDSFSTSKYSVFKEKILNHTDVTAISGAYTVPGMNSQFQISARRVGNNPDEFVTCQALPGDYGFVQTLGLNIIEGRDFSQEMSLDAATGVILNETAVDILGLDHPVGQKIIFPRNKKDAVSTVIGIVKNFHINSLHEKINPLLIFIEPEMFGTIIVKLLPHHSGQVIQYINETWKSIFPLNEMNSIFLKEACNNYYSVEEKTGKLITLFAGLAVFISCLGLFGLASFNTSKRVKEIGIRKVLGASSSKITVMLSQQFTKWVLISNVIAWPVAYYLSTLWLNHFAYRIPIGFDMFLISGLLIWSISILTVAYHAIKTALSNPVETLRYE